DWPAVQARRDALPPGEQARYRAFPYLHGDMGLAMAAADLAVSRAGASTLGEYPHFGLPAILAPLAFAWRYQQVNADWLAAHGAAVRLDNERLADELLPTIRAILSDPARLETMRNAARGLAGGDVAGTIADHVLALALAKNAQDR
ncbi:MAG: hypothetical protein IT323_17280, partial [Anaerolineae bacterium]|nr:hypothetical protein [Anaerolineae bacterium]